MQLVGTYLHSQLQQAACHLIGLPQQLMHSFEKEKEKKEGNSHLHIQLQQAAGHLVGLPQQLPIGQPQALLHADHRLLVWVQQGGALQECSCDRRTPGAWGWVEGPRNGRPVEQRQRQRLQA